jgi:hypothetical protein
MKFIKLITSQPFLLLALFGLAIAQPSKTPHPMVKSKSGDVSGVDTITSKGAANKTTKNNSGWNGSYVGVNAGTRFGATAVTNMVKPFGSSEQ